MIVAVLVGVVVLGFLVAVGAAVLRRRRPVPSAESPRRWWFRFPRQSRKPAARRAVTIAVTVPDDPRSILAALREGVTMLRSSSAASARGLSVPSVAVLVSPATAYRLGGHGIARVEAPDGGLAWAERGPERDTQDWPAPQYPMAPSAPPARPKVFIVSAGRAVTPNELWLIEVEPGWRPRMPAPGLASRLAAGPGERAADAREHVQRGYLPVGDPPAELATERLGSAPAALPPRGPRSPAALEPAPRDRWLPERRDADGREPDPASTSRADPSLRDSAGGPAEPDLGDERRASLRQDKAREKAHSNLAQARSWLEERADELLSRAPSARTPEPEPGAGAVSRAAMLEVARDALVSRPPAAGAAARYGLSDPGNSAGQDFPARPAFPASPLPAGAGERPLATREIVPEVQPRRAAIADRVSPPVAVWLYPLDGSGAGRSRFRQPLGGLPASGGWIGRSARATITVPAAGVSENHCRIEPTPQGWTIRDLDSRNGTYVDGERVHETTPLYSGAVIRLGKSVHLRFVVGDDQLSARSSTPPPLRSGLS